MISGTYNLSAESLSQIPLQELYLECDTTLAPVTINLFKIADLSRQWDLAIYISDATGNASVNPITVNCDILDHFDQVGANVVSITSNGGCLSLKIVSETTWLSSNGSGGVTPIDIEYNDLYDSIVNSKLKTGATYRLTDYRSVNFLNGWSLANNNPLPIDPSFNPREVYTSPKKEALLLTAISNYQLAPIAYSENYGGDILEFQGYTNKIGVDIGGIFNGTTLPDSSVVSGFDLKWDGTNVYFDMPENYPALFGHYFYIYAQFSVATYFQDGAFEPLTPVIAECQYNYNDNLPMSKISVSADGMKVILLDLTQTDYNNYDADSLYIDTIYAIGDAYGCITRRNDTQRNVNVPFDFRSRIYRRYEVDLSSVNTSFLFGYYGQGDNYLSQGTTGLYKDLLCFGNNNSDFYDIQWNGTGGYDANWYAGYCDNNVFLGQFFQNVFDEFTVDNTINYCVINDVGSNFSYNTIRSFENNKIRGSFSNNIIGGFGYNQICDYFASNNIGVGFTSNSINSQFLSNTIGVDFQLNTIIGNFNNNTIGKAFFNNYIQGFNGNQIGSGFALNQIEFPISGIIAINNFTKNSITTNVFGDFTLATHVYGNYNCTILQGSDTNNYISYFDGTSQIFATPINS